MGDVIGSTLMRINKRERTRNARERKYPVKFAET